MLKRFPFTQIHVPLVNWVIDDTLFQTIKRCFSSLTSLTCYTNCCYANCYISPIFFYLTGFRFVLLGDKKSGKINAGVSFQKVDCPTRSVSRNIEIDNFLEDKELTTDLTHDRRYLLSQKHLTVVCVTDLHSSIDKNQVYSGSFIPTWTHPWTPLPTWWRSSLSAADALVQSVSCCSHSAQTQFSENFWVWLHKPDIVTMVTHWNIITLKTYNTDFIGRACKSCNRK